MSTWIICAHCLGGGCSRCGFGLVRTADDDWEEQDKPQDRKPVQTNNEKRGWKHIVAERFKGHDTNKRLSYEELREFKCTCKKKRKRRKVVK